MKKFIICLIFLISFANAIQCYNGKTYIDIPESKLSEVGYTEYNITHSSFDCELATTLKGGTFLFLCIFMLFRSATF